MKTDCWGMTDVGRKRESNQDHFLIADLAKTLRVQGTSLRIDDHARIYGGSQGKLLVVADGMGGETAGERASTIAVDQIATYVLNSLSWCFRLEEESESDFEEHLRDGLKSCQESIRKAAEGATDQRGMGTTMTMAYVIWPRAYVLHVGDSRCYLMRDTVLNQITTDHTMAEVWAKVGQLTRAEANRSPMRHVLWNVLGGKSDELDVDVSRIQLREKDTLILCSDGLYGMITDEALQEIVSRSVESQETCRELINCANENGGADNITAIVCRFVNASSEAPIAFVETEVPLVDATAHVNA